jgi:ATP-dependent DNA helicase PIF1
MRKNEIILIYTYYYYTIIYMENHGKRWTDDDIKYIFNEIKNNSDINEIADNLKRTSSAVYGKIYQQAYFLINIIGIDINIISELIKISSHEILEYFNKHEKNLKNDKKLKDKNETINNNNNDTIKQSNNNDNDKNETLSDKQLLENNITKQIILNKRQQKALDKFKENKNIFITGPAGTGKSITLSKIIDYCKENNKKYGITATTGSAALLIGGKTIHSYLGLKIKNNTGHEAFLELRYKYKPILTKIRELDVLIIDEISMMDSELFDKISCFLCACRRSTQQFGGIQIVLTGDFCQLESIGGEYCFKSDTWDKLKLEVIFLNKMIRQDEDKTFKKMLGDLRYGICSDETFQKLLECKNTIFTDIKPTILYSRNSDVEKINTLEYDKLIQNKAEQYSYSIILPDLKKNHEKIKNWIKLFDIKESNNLCVGAQIVITANINQDKGLINGTRGKIIQLLPDRVIIIKIDGMIDTIKYHKCTYEDDSAIYFEYIPIKLAYALTIHKAQGMTLDALEIDIGDNIFASGQAYTALSRARNLKSIKIKNISKKSFIINTSVIEFYKQYDNTLI